MARIESCMKCGRGPAGAGGICVACATKANLPEKFDDMMKSFGLTAKVWQGNDKSADGIDLKDRYSLNPITRDSENKKISGLTSSSSSIYDIIKSYTNSNSKSSKASVNYMINPTIGGYITNVSSMPKNKYVFSLTGYSIRQANGFDKNASNSYGISSKSGYSSTNTYGGTKGSTYVNSSSTESSYSGKSSSGAVSGGKK